MHQFPFFPHPLPVLGGVGLDIDRRIMQGTKVKPGEKRQLQKGTMLLTVWYDKRQVAILSSNCNRNEQTTVERCTKEAPHVKDVKIPAAIH